MILSVSEIAQALGISRQAVNERCRKYCWQPIGKKTQGGGNRYDINAIPLTKTERSKIKSWQAHRTIEEVAATEEVLPAVIATSEVAAVCEPDLPAPATLKQWQRECMDARILFMRLIERAVENGSGVNNACRILESKSLKQELPPEVAALVPVANKRSGKDGRKRALSASTLIKWWSTWLKSGRASTSLAPKDPESDQIPLWAPYFLQCFRRPQKPSVPQAMAEMKTTLPAHIAMPSEDQVQRFKKKFSRLDLMKGRMTGAEMARHTPFTRRDASGFNPLDICLCDGHSFKAKVAHPRHGRPFKPEVCAVLCANTRAIVGWSAGLSESSQTVADALRHACTVSEDKPIGGVPAIFYTDKGPGNKADVNSHPEFGRYARLGVDFKTGRAGNARGRGRIERPNRSVWIPAAKTLATYTGKDMDKTVARRVYLVLEKEVREAKKENRKPQSVYLKTWPEFLELCQQTVDEYNNRPHSALPKISDAHDGKSRHMTPMEAWTKAIASGWRPEVLSADEINDLFRPWEEVTTRNGEVSLFGNIYFNADLAHYHGTKVIVEYEVQDGKKVWVRDREHHRLICIAGFEANKKDFFPKAYVDDQLEKRAAQREKRVLDKLDEIRAEKEGVICPVQVEQSPNVKAIRERLNTEFVSALSEPPRENVIPMPPPQDNAFSPAGTEKERYEQWRFIDRILQAGGTVTEAELNFHECFQKTSAFRGFHGINKNAVLAHGVPGARAQNE